MKKLLAGLALIGVLGAGGVLVYSSAADDPKEKLDDQEVENASVSADTTVEDEVVEEVEAPSERTVDTQGDVPWNYFTADQIIENQNAGEVVYLFSDAEALENYTVDLANNPDTTPYDKDTLATSWAGQIGAFLNGVSKFHPSQQDYFAKLEEAKNAMASFDYGNATALIEEAKTIRESQ